MAKIHKLKTLPSHFSAVRDGSKACELRVNDRNFREGEELLLEEFTPKDYWDPEDPPQDEYTGQILHRRITHVLSHHDGLAPGYVMLSLAKI